DRERVGTTSRQKQKFTHTVGSKSFASAADDEEKLKDKRVDMKRSLQVIVLLIWTILTTELLLNF
ncbi:hypothetical protein Gotur_006649, partial [Gossypium turneri]